MAGTDKISQTTNPDWQTLSKGWEKSGQPQKVFCKQHNVNYSQFGYQRGLLLQKQRHTKQSFLPATIKPAKPIVVTGVPSEAEVQLQLPCGVRVKLPWAADQKQLAVWLAALGVQR